MNFLHTFSTRFKSLIVPALVLTALISPFSTHAAGVSADESYKAIVKINTLADGLDGFLTVWQSGTGVIIDPKGIILTNEHVVALRYGYDDSDAVTGYQVCLTREVDQEPDCSYTAQLIAADKNSDLALLQIVSIAGLSSEAIFPYLESQTGSSANIGEDVTAIGYPAVGGETVSITSGIISGIQNKYDKKWLKTDAVISFGNSGGALINAAGKLVGITTEVYSDLAGSLGYAIDINGVMNWVSSKKSLAPMVSALQQRVAAFTKKQHVMNDSDTFTFDGYNTSITKPMGWEFAYPREDRLVIYNALDQDGGYVSMSLGRHDFPLDFNYVTLSARSELANAGMLGQANFLKDEIVKLNGISAKHIQITGVPTPYEQYVVPNSDIGVQFLFGYGLGDKDVSKVKDILNSITVQPRSAPALVTQYNNPKPGFTIKTNSDWYIERFDSKTSPLGLISKDFTSEVTFRVEKKTESTRFLSNDELLGATEKLFENLGQTSKSANIDVQVLSKSAHLKLNDSITDVIQISAKNSNLSTGQGLMYSYVVLIPAKDDYITIGLRYFGNDSSKFEAKVASFKQVLSMLSIEGMTATAPALPSGAVEGFDLTKVREAAYSISADKKLSSATGDVACEANTLIKGKSSAAVYYCGSDGKRYVFPNQQTYMTWYQNFDTVKTISDEALAKVSIGGIVTYRPGTRMIKIETDPRVYAVGANGELRPIASEQVAVRLYGNNWNKMIDDISDAFFINYRMGSTLE
jgi:hypothetical protein